MSDEIPDTPDKAVQLFIGLIALGFACGGGEVIMQGEIVLGVVGFLVAAFFSWASYKWIWLKSTIGGRLRDSIVEVATNAKWWVAFILLIFICLNILPLLRGEPWFPHLSGNPRLESGRIAWNFDQISEGKANFLNLIRLNQDEIRVVGVGVHGKNTSNDPISEFRGYIRSDLTNATSPFFIMADEPANAAVPPNPFSPQQIPTKPDETFGIPGAADFDLVTYEDAVFQQGMSGVPVSQFLREFGAFTVVLEYDGIKIERHFCGRASQSRRRKIRKRY